jgi:CPA2 family monovalent cation:H+ antiporter-2
MHDLPLITTIAAAFTAAWLLGLLTQWLKLSPIVGYLLAGVIIGPHTPGFVADIHLATQLAEVGVILLMFGVGLHFHLDDLLSVRRVAVPGAVGQSLVATLLGVLVALIYGWSLKSGVVIGFAVAVASTVVLIRVLTDNKLLDTSHGHVAIGWLIVEDIFTVIVLVLIPAMGTPTTGDHAAGGSLLWNLTIALLKLAALIAIVLVAGARLIPWVMVRVARLRSREMFTLTVLVMAIALAAGSYQFFGASMALGAFLAGMMVGQSPVSQQAAADALPLRDAFAVLFFASVGMLFDPMFIVREPMLLLAVLGIVLIGKPLAALLIVAVLGYPARTAIVVALGLAQIGEFSFILSELGRQHGLVNDSGHNVLVACAIVSITLNPILFRFLPRVEKWLAGFPVLWKWMNRNVTNEGRSNAKASELIGSEKGSIAVILGYGPVGRSVDSILRNRGVDTIIVDLNMDSVEKLTRAGRAAIYGDAYNIEVLSQAVARATHLVITLPHSQNRNPLITAAKLISPHLKIFVRARYIGEHEELKQVGADDARFEETEVAVALARLVLEDSGADKETIRHETLRVRRALQGT